MTAVSPDPAFSALLFANLLLAAATVAPLSRSRIWWIRGFDFPRLQLSLAGLGLLAIEAWLLDLGRPASWALVAVTLASVAYQAWWILPYTRLFPPEVRAAARAAPADRMRTMVANVLAPNRRSEALIALVREHRPDLLVTIESNGWWEERLAEIENDYPETVRCPLDNTYGMHLYSKLPLVDGRVEFLVDEDVPSIHAGVLLRSGIEVRAHFLHPAPPSPTDKRESSERDAELIVVGRSVAGREAPTIVSGDLNDVAWSRTTRLFRKISGLLDPRVGRGMYNTFHARIPLMRWPLDHLFHSEEFTLAGIRRLPKFGSDHFAILTDLVHDPVRGAVQEGLAAAPGDTRAAEEAVAGEPVGEADVPQPDVS